VLLAWGNIIDVFIDRGFGHNFHARTEWDLHFIDRVHALDNQAIADGRIKPTHLLARFQNEPGDCVCPPGMTPQSAVRVLEPVVESAPPSPAPPPPQPQPGRTLRQQVARIPGARRVRGWLRRMGI